MLVTKRKVAANKLGVLFQSDLHIGGRHVDYNHIVAELKYAKQKDYRININGDVFDAILPGDRKRFRMSVLHERLLHAGERLIDEAVEWAVEILSPYAHLIDVIGVGNHEDAVVKYHHVDPVAMLIKALNRQISGHKIAHGGYCGWIHYGSLLRIQYHHGTGGSAPVTKGLIDFNRTNTWVEGADIIWKGHKHTKTYFKDRVMSPDGILRSRINITTGAYGDDINIDTDLETKGRNASYVEDAFMAPQGKGGFFVTVQVLKNKKIITLIDREENNG